MIPKIIHQTISNKYNLDGRLVENIDKLKNLNPNWEYRLYDDQDRRNFIAQSYGNELLELYDKINPNYGQARADFFRYLLLYKIGGVYLDIKSTSLVPFDQIILDDDEYNLSQWNNDAGGEKDKWGVHPELVDLIPKGEYQIWHIISRAGHPFLDAVISKIMTNIKNYTPFNYGVGRLGVLRTTGPIPYTLAIEKIRSNHKHRIIDAEKSGLIHSIFGNDPLGERHHEIYKRKHYSTLSENVVLNNQSNKPKIAKIENFKIRDNNVIEIQCSEEINSLVMVASHERSGTHFAMNSIALNSPFSVTPHLNFDLEPLGAIINFTNPNALQEFFQFLIHKKCYNIIKSHFPIDTYKKDGVFIFPKDLKIIYLYRNPVDTMVSYKNFTDHFNKNNHEGPSSNNFVDFSISPPEGRMMRYQLYQNKTILERWEHHVSGWLKAADTLSNILPINYDDLNVNYEITINKILDFLEVSPSEKAIRPDKMNNTVHIPIHNNPSAEEREQLVKLIKEKLSNERLKDLAQ